MRKIKRKKGNADLKIRLFPELLAKELCERPQYNHSGTIFRTKIWCMKVLEIEEKNYEVFELFKGHIWTGYVGSGTWDQTGQTRQN